MTLLDELVFVVLIYRSQSSKIKNVKAVLLFWNDLQGKKFPTMFDRERVFRVDFDSIPI